MTTWFHLHLVRRCNKIQYLLANPAAKPRQSTLQRGTPTMMMLCCIMSTLQWLLSWEMTLKVPPCQNIHIVFCCDVMFCKSSGLHYWHHVVAGCLRLQPSCCLLNSGLPPSDDFQLEWKVSETDLNMTSGPFQITGFGNMDGLLHDGGGCLGYSLNFRW